LYGIHTARNGSVGDDLAVYPAVVAYFVNPRLDLSDSLLKQQIISDERGGFF